METKEITNEYLSKEFEKYSNKKENTIIRHALSHNSISSIVKTQDDFNKIDYSFSLEIETMKATNQKQSGRCWIFSALNVLREIIKEKYKLKEFELSQSYIAFYDKLEKVNFELEAIISLIGVEHDDRTLTHVLNNTISDGGQWDMFVSLVNKYGVVPKNVYPETFSSSQTRDLNSLIKVELNKFASFINDYMENGGIENVRKEKDKLLSKITTLLINAYGIPPKSFDFEYLDKDNKYHIERGYTPLEFYDKNLREEVNDYVSLINAPTPTKPFNKSYTIDFLGNVVGGKKIKHLNLNIDRIIELIIKQLENGSIVWFGSDVSFFRDREFYAWDDKSFDYGTAYGLNFDIDKGKALDYSISAMNHAMCITGVNIVDGLPTKWKIENSWGTDSAKNGYYLMSDTWFRKYVYQAVIKKEYLNKEELEAYNNEPIVLKPWDPMGSLAN